MTVGSTTVNSGTNAYLLYNNSGVLGNETVAAALDVIGSTQGDILYRGAGGWAVLAPGTNGYFLKTQGASANPVWATVSGSGTVTSIAPADGTLTFSPNPIVTTGTIGCTTATSSQIGCSQPDNQTSWWLLASLSTSAPNTTKTANYQIAATDMGGQVNFNGSGLTVTIPAISSDACLRLACPLLSSTSIAAL